MAHQLQDSGGCHKSPELGDRAGPVSSRLNSMFAEQWRGLIGTQAGQGDRLAQLPDSALLLVLPVP